MIQQETLSIRLERIRRRVRRLIWFDGLSRVAAIVIAAVFVAGMSDWLFHIDDPVFRSILAIGISATAIWASWRFLYGPLSRPFTDSDAAFRIEHRYPGFKDSLSSTVQFLNEGANPRLGSPELQQRVIDQTLAQLESIDLSKVFDTRGVRRIGVVAAAIGCVAFTTAAFHPSSARLAIKRLAFPFMANAWPRRTSLRLLNDRLEPIERREGEPLRVVRGKEFSIFVEDANGRPPENVRLEIQIGSAENVAERLRRASLRDLQGETRDVFAARIPTESGPVRFRAVGGDDDTMPHYDLEVIPPPAIEQLQVSLQPPAYSRIPAQKLSPGVGHLQAIVGTRVDFEARLDKPVAGAELRLGEEPAVALKTEDDRRTFRGQFTIAKEGLFTYGFNFRDDFGFRFDDARFEIRARADLVPQVSIDEPETDLTVTVDAQVPIRVTSRDDLGLRDIRLRYQIGESSDESAGVSLPFEGERTGPVTTGMVWNMADLRPKEGMRIDYHAEASDDFNLGPPHIGKSPHRSLTFVSRDQKANEVASKQLALLEQLQTIRSAQALAREQAGEIVTQWNKARELRAADVDTLKRIDLDQRRIATRLNGDRQGVAAQAQELLDELTKNHVDNAETEKRLSRIVGELSQLVGNRFPKIEQKLTDALKDAENSASAEKETKSSDGEPGKSGAAALDAARQDQAAVVEGLDAVLRDLGKWRDQRELQSELEGMISRQKELNVETTDVGKKTLTRALPELSLQEQADLARLAERQTQQADRLEKFAEEMKHASKGAEAGQPEKSSSFSDAQERLEQQANQTRMRAIADRLRTNRIGEASGEQQSVLKDLEEIEQLLKKNPERDLESQVAGLRDAEKEVEGLRKKQQEISHQTEALKKEDAAQQKLDAEQLRKEQQGVREKTQEMEPRLRRLEAARAERSISRAGSRMKQAEEGLEQNQGDAATENSAEAIEDLEQARRELAEKRREAEEQLARETLERMADTLQGMIARQQSVVDETLRLDGERVKRGNWSRGQLKSLSDLAANQKELKGETDELVSKVADAAVFAAALRSAASEMERAAERIEKRMTDAITVSAERRARQRFVDLVAALEKPKPDQNEQPPEEQNAEEGQPESSPPPTDTITLLAQLKLLKTLQVELAERTAALSRSNNNDGNSAIKSDDASEAARIAEEQGRLADLARDLAREIAKGASNDNAPKEER